MASDTAVRCSVSARRGARGLSLTALASRIGLSRQALTAIEAGRSTPSTAVALRLARELDCAVEDLFSLGPAPLEGLCRPELAGGRVALGHVAGRWVAHALDPNSATPAGGVVEPDGSVTPLQDPATLERSVLIAGCAPVLGVLSGRSQRHREAASWLQAGSGTALRWLAEQRVHVAGLHLAAWDDPTEHEDLVRQALPGVSVELVRLVGWRQGIVSAAEGGRPIRSLADLAAPGLRIARRPEGSGAALVLQRLLRDLDIDEAPSGPAVASHLQGAQAVRFGAADAAVVIEPVALAFGLPFLPLSEERFELVVRTDDLAQPGVQRLLDGLVRRDFAREIRGMGPYELAGIGDMRRVRAA